MDRRFFSLSVTLFCLALGTAALSQDVSPDPEDVKAGLPAKSYSPHAGRNYPTQVYWGDSHLHTSLSLDARSAGVILSPDDAYRFAKGEEITASKGMAVKLARPLDWLAVTDHSDAMGAMNRIIAGDPNLMTDPTVKGWHDGINQGGKRGFDTVMDVVARLSRGETPAILLSKGL